MLPFSSLSFFILAAIVVIVFLTAKKSNVKNRYFGTVIFITSFLYLILFYPKPWHVLTFALFSYLVHVIYIHILKIKLKLPGILLLLAPMILVKAHIHHDIISYAGLSYISFRVIQHFIDSDHSNSKIPNPITYFSFLTFFPTILVGPIDRYNRFENDIKNGFANINRYSFTDGWQELMYGILYKFVLAEITYRYWLSGIDPESYKLLDMTNYMYAYTLYLYLDFAGYSAMAVGLGKMLGINVPINFNKPFLARNPQDFWQRWHKSLGDWLKDYFFRPIYKELSSNKKIKLQPLVKQNIALFSTFFLMGCWNGFQKYYIISGSLFGFYSVIHNTYLNYCRRKKRDIIFGKLPEKYVKYISIFIMINTVAFAIYIFSGKFPYL